MQATTTKYMTCLATLLLLLLLLHADSIGVASQTAGVVTSNVGWSSVVYLFGGYNGTQGPVGPQGPTPPTTQFYVYTGNAFSQSARVGTTDAYPVSLITNNQTRLSISSSGAIALPYNSQLLQFKDSGSNTFTLAAPPVLTANYTLLLPSNAPPSAESVLVANTAGSSWWQPVLPPYVQSAAATSVTYTSTTTVVAIADTTITLPSAGVYQFSFTAVVSHSSISNNAAVSLQLYIDSTTLHPTARALVATNSAAGTPTGGATASISAILPGMQAGQTLMIGWRAVQAGTITCLSRTIYAIRLGPG